VNISFHKYFKCQGLFRIGFLSETGKIHDQRNYEKYQENIKDYFSDARCPGSNTTESEYCRNKGNDEKYDNPSQHSFICFINETNYLMIIPGIMMP